MANKITYEELEKLYREASEGQLYPDAILASESWFRFRMGDAAVDNAFQTGQMRVIAIDEILDFINDDSTNERYSNG